MTDRVPLYPSESELAILVLGTKKAKEWPRIASYLENKLGLPRVDGLMGGRFWPAVDAYFRIRHGMGVDSINKGRVSTRVRVVPFRPDTPPPEKS